MKKFFTGMLTALIMFGFTAFTQASDVDTENLCCRGGYYCASDSDNCDGYGGEYCGRYGCAR